jgi:hypothetical protein
MIWDEEREFKILVLQLLHHIGRNLPPNGIPEEMKKKSNDFIESLAREIKEKYRSAE